jgi:hypothetical protein
MPPVRGLESQPSEKAGPGCPSLELLLKIHLDLALLLPLLVVHILADHIRINAYGVYAVIFGPEMVTPVWLLPQLRKSRE